MSTEQVPDTEKVSTEQTHNTEKVCSSFLESFHDKHSGLQFCLANQPEEVKDNGISDYGIIKWCDQFLNPKGLFLDIGADIGKYSMILSPYCKTVHAFESRPNYIEALNLAMVLNNRYNITIHTEPLSNRNKDVFVFDFTEAKAQQMKEEGSITQTLELVQVKAVDYYRLTNISLIHIHDDNNLLDIIKGLGETLLINKFPPIVFHQANTFSKGSVMALLKATGYKIHTLTGAVDLYLAADHHMRPKEQDKPSEEKAAKEVLPSHNVLQLMDQYETDTIPEDKSKDWNIWYVLAKHFRLTNQWEKSYDCCCKGKECLAEDEGKSKLMRFNEELCMICHHINKLDDGYEAADSIALNSSNSWATRNNSLHNQRLYMDKLPFHEVIRIHHDLPEDYRETSSSIIKQGSGFLFNLRAVNYSINHRGGYMIRDPENKVRTKNYLLSMNSDLQIGRVVEVRDESKIKVYPKDILGMEDIRLFGDHEFFCTYLEVNETRTPQICYCVYDDQGRVTRVTPLKIGDKVQCEKNWMPFVKDGEVMFIYSFEPFRIYKIDRNTFELSLVKECKLFDELCIDGFRGSSGLIEYKGGWLGTVHQVYHSEPREYYHRFIWFDYEFKEMRFGRLFYFESPSIEYNLSLCLSDRWLLMPYSVRDNSSKIGLLDYAFLNAMLELE
jgi:FkbM family methyltransferase